jgi:hypothetical protein
MNSLLHHTGPASGQDQACPGCGEKYRHGVQFCSKCGRPRAEAKDDSDMKIMLRKALYIARTRAFLVVFIWTWLCFAATLLLFTYGYMMIPLLCWSWSTFILICIFIALLFDFYVKPGQHTKPLSGGCFIAVVLGTLLGLYVYDTAAIFPMFYKHSREYTDVVSSEPSGAVADAGKLVFNDQARVKVNQSIGYTEEDGMVYCVAPVEDPVAQARVEYWAAGVNCCAESGAFTCDSAMNAEAHGGIVVMDNNGWFTPARWPFYEKARQKAEARYALQSVGFPLYVRWVEKENLDYLADYYGSRATWNIVGMLFIFMVLSALYSFGMWQPRSMV